MLPSALHRVSSTGKSLASIGLEAGSTFFTPAMQETPADAKIVSDPEPLSYAKPQPHPEQDVAQSFRKTAPEIPTENVATAGYNINLARKVAMGSQLRLKFEQDVRILKKATTKITRRDQRIQAREDEIKRLDQEIKSLRTVEAKVHGLRNRTKNLETLFEAVVDIKKAAEAK
ncbi:hypothetical protein Tco_0136148, partial [Tanacetum coccineum]